MADINVYNNLKRMFNIKLDVGGELCQLLQDVMLDH